MHCDVVIVGYRLNAREPAPKALERILRLTPDAARTLARSFPAMVAQGMPEPEATALADALRTAGAQVELRPTGEPSVSDLRMSLRAATRAPSSAVTPIAAEASRPQPSPPLAAPQAREQPALRFDNIPAATDHARDADEADPTTIYQLGDFGLESGHAPPAAEAAPPPRGAGIEDFDLDLADGGLSLELERPENENARRPVDAATPAFDDRFDDLAGAPTPPPPKVEERAVRAIQREQKRRAMESHRPPTAARRAGSPLVRALREWLPSIAMLAALIAGTIACVGYALNPGDMFAVIRSPRSLGATAPAGPTTGADEHELHPLLQVAPSAARGPLATILRTRVAGVHRLPMSFRADDGRTIECLLVEQRPDDTDARLDALRRTGHEVAPPADAVLALREHAQNLRMSRGAGQQITLTSMCLAP